jgi:hypothetical protein
VPAERQRQNDTAGVVPFVEVPREPATNGWAAEALTHSGVVRVSLTASPAWAGQLIRDMKRINESESDVDGAFQFFAGKEDAGQ